MPESQLASSSDNSIGANASTSPAAVFISLNADFSARSRDSMDNRSCVESRINNPIAPPESTNQSSSVDIVRLDQTDQSTSISMGQDAQNAVQDWPEGTSTEQSWIEKYIACEDHRQLIHHPLRYTWATRQTIRNEKVSVKPPFPRVGSATTTHFSLMAPPTMFSFGGSFNGCLQQDLFSFSPDPQCPELHLTVSVLNTRGSNPAPRSDAVLAANNGQLFLWGGQLSSEGLAEQDTNLYVLKLSTHSWTRSETSGPSPHAVAGSNATLFKDFLYLFAGENLDGSINGDLWRIGVDWDTSPSPLYWHRYSFAQDLKLPPARTRHSAVQYRKSWIIFGGTSGMDLLNNLWEYSFENQEWKPISCSGLIPAPRKLHSATRIEDYMYVLGGTGDDGAILHDMYALNLKSHVWYALPVGGLEQIINCGQLLASWNESIYVWGGQATNLGKLSNTSLYHTLNIPVNPTSASQPLSPIFSLLAKEEYPTNPFVPHRRIRPQKQMKHHEKAREKREAPLCLPNQHHHIYHRVIEKSRQHDPCPSELFTSQKTIKEEYYSLTHGVCIVAPEDLPPFCMAAWYPFETMAADEKKGWERFVLHLLSRIDYVAEVKTNGPQKGGTLWGDGWRKCSKNTEHFGRFCAVEMLRKQMRLLRFDPDDQKARLLEAGKWLSDHLKAFAPTVHKNYHETLTINQYPSMNHTEFGEPYTSSDFASFLTFTMYDFYNLPHNDNDVNDWTLVGWIPIFNPQNGDNPQILANEGFDMIGGQFTFRDFQVCLDLNKTLGVTLCVFRSQDYRHQTLSGCSPSGMYTRLGFSCQINERMAKAITAYIQGHYEKKLKIGGLNDQIEEANAPPKKRKT